MLSILNTDRCKQPQTHTHTHTKTHCKGYPRKLLEVMNIFIFLIVVKVT